MTASSCGVFYTSSNRNCHRPRHPTRGKPWPKPHIMQKRPRENWRQSRTPLGLGRKSHWKPPVTWWTQEVKNFFKKEQLENQVHKCKKVIDWQSTWLRVHEDGNYLSRKKTTKKTVVLQLNQYTLKRSECSSCLSRWHGAIQTNSRPDQGNTLVTR